MGFLENAILATASRATQERIAAKSLSLVFIACTNPVALVFKPTSASPLCVARVGCEPQLQCEHEVMRCLLGGSGFTVPEPWAILSSPSGDFIGIESGLPGIPWFQLQNQFPPGPKWDALADRVSSALLSLHSTAALNAEWRSIVRPGDQLRLIAPSTEDIDELDATATRCCLERLAKELDDLQGLPTVWQHGDFCLNNIIVDTDTIGIVDFEDFGKVTMPLHDDCNWALSLHEHAHPDHDATSSVASVLQSLRRHPLGKSLTDHQRLGFVIHWLIWMCNHARHERRAARRRHIIRLLCHALDRARETSRV